MVGAVKARPLSAFNDPPPLLTNVTIFVTRHWCSSKTHLQVCGGAGSRLKGVPAKSSKSPAKRWRSDQARSASIAYDEEGHRSAAGASSPKSTDAGSTTNTGGLSPQCNESASAHSSRPNPPPSGSRYNSRTGVVLVGLATVLTFRLQSSNYSSSLHCSDW